MSFRQLRGTGKPSLVGFSYSLSNALLNILYSGPCTCCPVALLSYLNDQRAKRQDINPCINSGFCASRFAPQTFSGAEPNQVYVQVATYRYSSSPICGNRSMHVCIESCMLCNLHSLLYHKQYQASDQLRSCCMLPAQPLSWKADKGTDLVLSKQSPLAVRNPINLKLAGVKSSATIANYGYWGLNLQQGYSYALSVYLNALTDVSRAGAAHAQAIMYWYSSKCSSLQGGN